LVAGDFNIIRNISSRQGPSFSINTSRGFNSCIAYTEINEIALPSRKFIWAGGGSSLSMPLLHRLFCDDSWDNHFSIIPSHVYPKSCLIIAYLFSILPPTPPLKLKYSDLNPIGCNMRSFMNFLKHGGMRSPWEAMLVKDERGRLLMSCAS
jgi:hypothetical protein